MKKIILSLCVLGLLTGTAYAACNGGTMRGGFCVSNVTMNWWSAAAWCQANGMSLATMYEACPDWNGNVNGDYCGRIIDVSLEDYCWTSTANGKNAAYAVNLSNGSVLYTNRNINTYAVCR